MHTKMCACIRFQLQFFGQGSIRLDIPLHDPTDPGVLDGYFSGSGGGPRHHSENYFKPVVAVQRMLWALCFSDTLILARKKKASFSSTSSANFLRTEVRALHVYNHSIPTRLFGM